MKTKAKILLIIAFFLFIVGLLLYLNHTIPPDVEKARVFYADNKEDIQRITEYFITSEFGYAVISNNDKTMNADYRNVSITSKEINECIDRLWDAGCNHISMDDSGDSLKIILEIWYRFDEACGIAFSNEEDKIPHVQYQTKLEPLMDGWYYYYSDYNTWRSSSKQGLSN